MIRRGHPSKVQYTNVEEYIFQHFLMVEKWKESKCPSTKEWMDQFQYILKGEYHAAVKINELKLYVSSQINLKYYSVEWGEKASCHRTHIEFYYLITCKNPKSNSICFYAYIYVVKS